MEIQHLTIAAQRGRRLPLFPDEARYRVALRRLGRVVARAAARVGLALFGLIDEHLHLLACGTRAAVGRLGHAVRCSLKNLVATPLDTPFPRKVTNRWHLQRLLEYFIDQPRRHDLPLALHHSLFVGSCLPDLLGARRVDGLRLCISRVLPRYRPALALEMAGLPTSPLVPAEVARMVAVGDPTGDLRGEVARMVAVGDPTGDLRGEVARMVAVGGGRRQRAAICAWDR